MLTPQRFDELLALWKVQFSDRRMCAEAAHEYVKTAIAPDEARFNAWMQNALSRDHLVRRAARAEQEANTEDPEVHPSVYALGTCYHCSGRGVVRHDVAVGHSDFGKARPCPACANSSRNPAEHCEKCAGFSAEFLPISGQNAEQNFERNRCGKCGRFEGEPAAETCKNPRWHTLVPVVPPAGRRDYVGELAGHLRSA